MLSSQQVSLNVQGIQIPQNPESEEFSKYVVEMEKLKAKVNLLSFAKAGLVNLPRAEIRRISAVQKASFFEVLSAYSCLM